MSQEMETTLRKSLDEVDKIRRRQMVGLAIFLCLFLLLASSQISTLHNAAANHKFANLASLDDVLRVTLITDAELMVFTVVFCTLGVGLFISRMTTKILKAIELSSKA